MSEYKEFTVHGTWSVRATDEEDARERIGDGVILETSAHPDDEWTTCEVCTS